MNTLSGFAEPSATDERARIVAAAQALYLQQGLTSVSLDDLADSLYLPPETVHRWFPAKALLVSAVVDALAGLLYQALHRHKESSRNAVEELFALCGWAGSALRTSYAAFFQQLEAHFPVAWQRWQEHTAFPLEHLRNNLLWGVLQDLYQAHADVELQAEHWYQRLSTVGFETEVQPLLLLADLLAGVVSPAGIAVVRRLQATPAR
ncbi:TetR/AcrR family transcriptional regulator [Hymenobacter monticola]|uniref:HTH tetR-type domain-containing protein n=1 Tax=Hymenobacter monticola TaxID=1705399 RepID=A0ABY4BF79_9BACT|nr:hypothetical protein [Hymenobacter monticola]UOE36433.1 hypothetical protein MTP16_24050 [Hymenobacter monticola]